jgi:diguanylate cyclase (GGDEF)-like protein
MDIAKETVAFGLPVKNRETEQSTVVLSQSIAFQKGDHQACLVHIYPKGPALGQRFSIHDQTMTIGRHAECSLSVSEGSVSRKHAQIDRLPDGRYIVTDLASTNGTFINNLRTTHCELRDGDYLRVGQVIYRFLSGGNIEAHYHEEIYRLTVLDPLTGLHNRRSLMDYLDREVERASRTHLHLAVALFDIDHFKTLNDRMGHIAGDFTLVALASRLRPMIRKHELLARYGGEEFALVMTDTPPEEAYTAGERVRQVIANEPFLFESMVYPVTVSVGVGSLELGEDLATNDLLNRADQELYRAKSQGRNRVCSYDAV